MSLSAVDEQRHLAAASLSLSGQLRIGGDGCSLRVVDGAGGEVLHATPLTGVRAASIVVQSRERGEEPSTCLSVATSAGKTPFAVDQLGNVTAAGAVRAQRAHLAALDVKQHGAFGEGLSVGKRLSVAGELDVRGGASVQGGLSCGPLSCTSLEVSRADGRGPLLTLMPEVAVLSAEVLHMKGAAHLGSLRVTRNLNTGTLVCAGGARVTDIVQCEGLSVHGQASVDGSAHVSGALAVGGGVKVGGAASAFGGAVRMGASASVHHVLHVAPALSPSAPVREFEGGGGGVFVGEAISLDAASGAVECTSISCRGLGFALDAGDGTHIRNGTGGLDVCARSRLLLRGPRGVLVEAPEGEVEVRAPGGLKLNASSVSVGGAARLAVGGDMLTLSCARTRIVSAVSVVGGMSCSGPLHATGGVECGGKAVCNVARPSSPSDAATAGFVEERLTSRLPPPQYVTFEHGSSRPHALTAGGDVFVTIKVNDSAAPPVVILPSSASCEDGVAMWVHLCESRRTDGLRVACSTTARDAIGALGDKVATVGLGQSRRFVLCKKLGLWMGG